jgi:hypothetical protein
MPNVFHSIHKGWGVISGPGNQPESEHARQSEPPGEFVSDELRDACARFLDEVRTQIHRREEPREADDWVPAPPPPERRLPTA